MALSQESIAMETNSKPYTRYWWFASEIKKEDIRYNLDWLKKNGFGGVELAWVYPLNAMDAMLDSAYTPRQKWLSPEWQEIINYTLAYADSLGLGCDMTMGTLWPFGDSYVKYSEASQQFGKNERQQITRSWEYPNHGYVVDHLKPEYYQAYFHRLLDSFPNPDTKIPRALFIDSWEVETEKLWTDRLEDLFMDKYGYDIIPFIHSIYNPVNKDYLYDYMKLISEKVIQFYDDFDRVLDKNDLFSRGQCSGAPCDILSAYARLDIPEGEAMLYEPEFSSIPASSALLSSKKVVSAETFTCLYGWPRNYIREEQTADLKMVADALFANGINHIIWHGKAHNPKDQDSVNFYATVHIGDDGALADELPSFNRYLALVSEMMKKGSTYSDVAVYLPVEDAWIKGIMPEEKQFIWAWGYYEMRYIYFPQELHGHHPIWINKEFLEKGKIKNGVLHVGDASFHSLYVDANYLDYTALKRILTLANEGLPVTLKRDPAEPGTNKHANWDQIIEQIRKLPNVSYEFYPQKDPLVEGKDLPQYWARVMDKTLYIYFANPKSRRLSFPVSYGQSFCQETYETNVVMHYEEETFDLTLQFEPYQSLLYKIEDGRIEEIDISFVPKTPIVKELPADLEKPWLVK